MVMKFQTDANERWDLKIPEERKQAAKSCLKNAEVFARFAGTAYSAAMIKVAITDLPKPIDIDEYSPAKPPMFVNLTLAIELYLKALLMSKEPDRIWTKKDVDFLHTHEIEYLFDALEEPERDAIYDLLAPCCTSKDRDEFDLNIHEISNGFARLRYHHEMKGFAITGDFIYSLTTAVANYVTGALEGEIDGAKTTA